MIRSHAPKRPTLPAPDWLRPMLDPSGERPAWPPAALMLVFFAGSVAFFCLAQVLDGRLNALAGIAAILGSATCGWSWLLARALFRRPEENASPWPFAVVGLLMATAAVLEWSGGWRVAYDGGLAPLRIAANLHQLLSSLVLLMALVEALRPLSGPLPQHERRFCIGFASGYFVLLTIAVLWVNGAPQGLAAAWADWVRVAAALVALLGGALAVWLRTRMPLPQPAGQIGRRKPRKTAAPGANDPALAARLRALLETEDVYTNPELKLADFARLAGDADHKVSQCISGALGFRNFNHLINHYRVERAKVLLADPGSLQLSVLAIAMDCGFGSIGPFNRAFKEQVGVTPTQYRAMHRPDRGD